MVVIFRIDSRDNNSDFTVNYSISERITLLVLGSSALAAVIPFSFSTYRLKKSLGFIRILSGNISFIDLKSLYAVKNKSYLLSSSRPYLSNQYQNIPKIRLLFSASPFELNVIIFG